LTSCGGKFIAQFNPHTKPFASIPATTIENAMQQ